MQVASRSKKKTAVNLQSESFSLSNAKTYLGRLIEKASKGEVVYILSGQNRFILQQVQPIDPIPMRPPGYYANCYSEGEIREDNQLAKASVSAVPRDLE